MALISAAAQAKTVSAGPYEVGSALYVVVSLASSIAVFKSTDSGATWAEQDSAGAPSGGHVWYDVHLSGTKLYVVHVSQTGSSPFTADLPVSIFDTSSDTWDLTTPSGPSIDYTSVSGSIITPNGIGCKIRARTNGDIVVVYLTNRGTGTDLDVHFDIYNGSTWTTVKPSADFQARRIASAWITTTDYLCVAYYRAYSSDHILDSPEDSLVEEVDSIHLTSQNDAAPNTLAFNEEYAYAAGRNLKTYPTNSPRIEAELAATALAFGFTDGEETFDDVSAFPAQITMNPLSGGFDRINTRVVPANDFPARAGDTSLLGDPSMHSVVASDAVFVIWVSGTTPYRSYWCSNFSTDFDGLFKDVGELGIARSVTRCPMVEILASGEWGVVYEASAGGVYYETLSAPATSCPTPTPLEVSAGGNSAWFG